MRRLLDRVRGAIEAVLDAIIPLRARSARIKERSAADIPLVVTEHELLDTLVTTLMEYRTPAVQDLIRALKYDRSRYAAKIAADLLADYLREEVAAIRTFSTKEIVLIPLPLHASRQRERGFNQIQLVLESLPREFRDGTLSRLSADALERTKYAKPQTRLSRKERIKNVVGAFAVTNPQQIKNKHVFVIDDVTTTGATLLHAGKPLTKAGAEVSLIALARA